MNLRIAVVHEAQDDFDIATHLADDVILEAIEWLDRDLLPFQREWIARNPDHVSLKWKTIPRLARELNIKAHGHIKDEPLEIEAGATRRAIRYLKAIFEDLNAVILIRDQDDEPRRLEGLKQARNEDHGNLVVVIGLAIIEREAWVLAGFQPQDESEQALLDVERQTLGFQPHEQSHRLTAGKDDNAKLSPKRVLSVLCRSTTTRERLCWTQTPLAILRERGTSNGLSHYLDEVRTRLVPLFGNTKP